MTTSELAPLIVVGKYITISTSDEHSFENRQGYIEEVGDNFFIFGIVTNLYEHFSNISDPPITRPNKVFFKNVISASE